MADKPCTVQCTSQCPRVSVADITNCATSPAEVPPVPQEIIYLFLACLTEPDSLDGANEFSALLVELNDNNNASKSVSQRSLSVMQSLYLVSLQGKLLYNNQSVYIQACLTEVCLLDEAQ